MITPLPTKPARQKCQRTEAGERGSAACRCVSVVFAALDAKYTKELADAKAENDALHDGLAAGHRGLRQRSVSQCVTTTASGVDNAASPTGRHR